MLYNNPRFFHLQIPILPTKTSRAWFDVLLPGYFRKKLLRDSGTFRHLFVLNPFYVFPSTPCVVPKPRLSRSSTPPRGASTGRTPKAVERAKRGEGDGTHTHTPGEVVSTTLSSKNVYELAEK